MVRRSSSIAAAISLRRSSGGRAGVRGSAPPLARFGMARCTTREDWPSTRGSRRGRFSVIVLVLVIVLVRERHETERELIRIAVRLGRRAETERDLVLAGRRSTLQRELRVDVGVDFGRFTEIRRVADA